VSRAEGDMKAIVSLFQRARGIVIVGMIGVVDHHAEGMTFLRLCTMK
jgi:hypothetical protein